MRFIFTIFILLFTNNWFVVLGQSSQYRKLTLETLSEQNFPVNDTITLTRVIQKEIDRDKTSYLHNDLQILKNVLLANAHANIVDKINPRSDTLFHTAIQASQKEHKRDLYIWATIEYAFYLYTYRFPAKAMPYFVRAMHEMEQLPEDKRLNTANSFKKIAYFTSTLGDQQETIKYLTLAQKYAKPGTRDSGDILNSLGRYYLRLKDYVKADHYFQLTLSESQKNGDRIREAKVYGDIAELYQINGQYDEAETALLRDISLSRQHDNPQNTMFAQIMLTKLMLKQNKLTEASAALHEAMIIAESKPYFKSSEYEIVKLQITLARKLNDERLELLSHRRLDTLEKHLALTDGKSVLQQVSIEAQKEILNLSLETERGKRQREVLIRRAFVAIGVLLLVIILFVVIAYRRRNKLRLTNYENRVMKLQLEKVTSENKLNETRKTLSAYREYLSDKNNQIETLQKEIEHSKNSPLSSIETRSGKLQELLQSHLMSESNWQTFKEVFIQDEPLYYQYVHENFEGLTDSNMRILFLQKMGFNNPRIAQILGITVDAVKKNKQRMRKKYGESYNAHYSMEKVEEDDEDPDTLI